jgi:hypothetical protein
MQQGPDASVCASLEAAADREIARIPVSRATGLVSLRARARAGTSEMIDTRLAEPRNI